MNAITRDENRALSCAVLEIDVANHPGVMSHVVGLFARRAFNVEGIVCLPVGDGRCSRIWLRVQEDARLAQLIRQLEKLEDVAAVRRHPGGHAVFAQLAAFFRPGELADAGRHDVGKGGIRAA